MEDKILNHKWQKGKSTPASITMRLMLMLPVGESFWAECGIDTPRAFQNEWNRKNPHAELRVKVQRKQMIDPKTVDKRTLLHITILHRNDEE